MKVIDGKILCKKELPKSFPIMRMEMPKKYKLNECVPGLRSCGNLVSKFTQYCLPFEVMCPINGLEIVKMTPEIRTEISNSQGQIKNISSSHNIIWQYKKFSEDYAIAISTTKPSHLLVSLYVGEKGPCLN